MVDSKDVKIHFRIEIRASLEGKKTQVQMLLLQPTNCVCRFGKYLSTKSEFASSHQGVKTGEIHHPWLDTPYHILTANSRRVGIYLPQKQAPHCGSTGNA